MLANRAGDARWVGEPDVGLTAGMDVLQAWVDENNDTAVSVFACSDYSGAVLLVTPAAAGVEDIVAKAAQKFSHGESVRVEYQPASLADLLAATNELSARAMDVPGVASIGVDAIRGVVRIRTSEEPPGVGERVQDIESAFRDVNPDIAIMWDHQS
ncbi:hypothetical protein [Microbacterium gorillae]|uniref:hypothetical protein n=1 Tax=Microbacterium gorillae TaxID=1231063 RepID=UPI0012B5F827|nr:hypothetical protein [Microbacterium gorillae]